MILAGRDAEVAQWMQRRIPQLHTDTPYIALGLLNSQHELIAGALFDNYIPGINIDGHLAAKRLSKEFLRTIFAYPFEQLGVRRITARVAASNAASQRWCEKSGFTLEGRIRQGCESGEDMLIFGMLRHECRQLEISTHGKELSARRA